MIERVGRRSDRRFSHPESRAGRDNSRARLPGFPTGETLSSIAGTPNLIDRLLLPAGFPPSQPCSSCTRRSAGPISSKQRPVPLAYEDSLFDPQVGNWPDLRSGSPGVQAPSSPSYAVARCHGVPGIALARFAPSPSIPTTPTPTPPRRGPCGGRDHQGDDRIDPAAGPERRDPLPRSVGPGRGRPRLCCYRPRRFDRRISRSVPRNSPGDSGPAPTFRRRPARPARPVRRVRSR